VSAWKRQIELTPPAGGPLELPENVNPMPLAIRIWHESSDGQEYNLSTLAHAQFQHGPPRWDVNQQGPYSFLHVLTPMQPQTPLEYLQFEDAKRSAFLDDVHILGSRHELILQSPSLCPFR
jgi:hypothetical protein